MEQAVVAAGCFWGVQHFFEQLDGVCLTEVGYTGGSVENPSYHDVCRGDTGHAEAVRLEFDPDLITYEEVIRHFFQCHNPTTLNSQGPDYGTQYRSAVFYCDARQRDTANKVMAQLQAEACFSDPIVTQVTPFSVFYRAEESHQHYLRRHRQ